MVHVFGAEEVTGNTAEYDHSDERWNFNLGKQGLYVKRSDFTRLEFDSFHHYLNQYTSY